MVAAAAAALALAGCAVGVRPAGGGWVVAGKGYRVAAPAGWARIPSDADLAFRHPALGAGLMAHGTCDARTPTRSPAVLARHLRFGLRDVQDLEQAPVELGGRAGVRSRFRARLDGVPVAVTAATVLGPACVYDLVVVAPPEGLPAAAPDFERFAASFVLLEGSRP